MSACDLKKAKVFVRVGDWKFETWDLRGKRREERNGSYVMIRSPRSIGDGLMDGSE